MDKIDELVQKIRTGLGEDQQLKVLTSLFGPMARRMQGLEDSILFILDRSRFKTEMDAYEVDMLMRAMGYTLADDGKYRKTHE